MFNWASEQLNKISQTVAPPATDPPSRFVYCCQQRDEQGAMELVGQLAGAGMIVNQAKQAVSVRNILNKNVFYITCLVMSSQVWLTVLTRQATCIISIEQTINFC